MPWGSPPEAQGFQGGDLYGVIEKLDYLEALGVNALYFNPIFASASNHRYHTYDYYQVDPLLGGNEAFRILLDAAHVRGIRVVLDGVFNHASRGFWPFHHILETGRDSPYLDWFIIQDWPLNPYPVHPGQPLNYAAWWALPALPKFNTDHPAVRDYIFDVARHWIAFGIDGWRLDVPQEIDDEDFWRTFRKVVKAANPEAYIVGEIWEPAPRWLKGDQFDAVMNYPFMDAALSFFGGRSLRRDYHRAHLDLKPLDAPAMAHAVEAMHSHYDWAINHVQLNVLGSHDTARARWIMGEDRTALELCVLFQMTMPGAPCIYYGDEVGLSAGDDPACRTAFPWHNKEFWDTDLLAHYQAATALRHQHPVLRTGLFETVFARKNTYAFLRRLGDVEAFVVFNVGEERDTFTMHRSDAGQEVWTQVWPPEFTASIRPQSETSKIGVRPREGQVWIKG